MATNEKSTRVIETTLNHSIRQISIDVQGVGTLVMHADRLSDACKVNAIMLGLKNTIVDTAAKSRDPATGLPASNRAKYDAMKARIEHLESGTDQWAVRALRTSANEDALLILALMEVLGQSDRAKVAGAVKSWDSAKRAAVRMREDVKLVLDRMLSESAADVDTDDLLAEII